MAVIKLPDNTAASVHIAVGVAPNKKTYSVAIGGLKVGATAENIYNIAVALAPCLIGSVSYINMRETSFLEQDG